MTNWFDIGWFTLIGQCESRESRNESNLTPTHTPPTPTWGVTKRWAPFPSGSFVVWGLLMISAHCSSDPSSQTRKNGAAAHHCSPSSPRHVLSRCLPFLTNLPMNSFLVNSNPPTPTPSLCERVSRAAAIVLCVCLSSRSHVCVFICVILRSVYQLLERGIEYNSSFCASHQTQPHKGLSNRLFMW